MLSLKSLTEMFMGSSFYNVTHLHNWNMQKRIGIEIKSIPSSNLILFLEKTMKTSDFVYLICSWLRRTIKRCTTILLTACEPTSNVSGQVFIHECQTELIHLRRDGEKWSLIENKWTLPNTMYQTPLNKHKRELKIP